MRKWLWIVLLVSGCGRIGFDTELGAADASFDTGAAPRQSCEVARAQLRCAAGATLRICDNTCWFVCKEPITANEATTRCGSVGARLAPLESVSDEACVRDELFPGVASWIGYHQAAAQSDRAAGWTWNDMTIGSVVTWHDGQPDDDDAFEDGEEQCAYMATYGEWQDESCSQRHQWSCRL